MTLRVQMGTDGDGDDPGKVPDGAKGDGNRVTIPDNKSSGNADDGGQDGGDDSRPEWLPEKFESPEDMAKAYSELETKMGSGDDGDDDGPTLENPREAVEDAGFDADKLRQEMLDNDGSLTDETMESLEEAGFSREVVNDYIEGQKAIAREMLSDIQEMAGGEEAFGSMMEWAEDGLSKEEIQAFNAAMDSQNTAQISLAVRGLRAAYEASEGRDPSLLRPGSRRDSGVKPFASNEEMVRAMRDKRYREDPAYRADVKKRIAAGM